MRTRRVQIHRGGRVSAVQVATSPTQGPATRARERHDEEVVVGRIKTHLSLVGHVVFQVAVHYPRHVDREELTRAGALGLVEAARRFDEARGVPFERFAAQRIRGAILDAVRAEDWAPRSVRVLARRLEQVEQQLAAQLGRVPRLGEVAAEIGVHPDELAQLQHRLFRSVVLALEHEVMGSAAAGEDEQLTLLDVLCDRSTREPSEELEFRELRCYLRDAVELLPERHRMVIVGYFLEGRTSQAISQLLGVTESRVSQVRTEALAMLRDGIGAQYGPSGGACEDAPAASGRVARRKARYAAAIGTASAWRNRVSASAEDSSLSLAG